MTDSERYEIKGYTISRKKNAKSIAGLSFGFTKEVNTEAKKESSIVEKFVTDRILPALASKTEGFDRDKKIKFLKDKCGVDDCKELNSKSITDLRKIEREILR